VKVGDLIIFKPEHHGERWADKTAIVLSEHYGDDKKLWLVAHTGDDGVVVTVAANEDYVYVISTND
jgi:hypothetical protein